MAIQKITKRDNFKLLLTIEEVANNERLVEFINRELELLNNKSKSKKSSKDKPENIELAKNILSILGGAEDGMLVSEILVQGLKLGVFSDTVTTPKLTSLLKNLKDVGKVTRTVKGKKAIYAIAPTEEDAEEGE